MNIKERTLLLPCHLSDADETKIEWMLMRVAFKCAPTLNGVGDVANHMHVTPIVAKSVFASGSLFFEAEFS